MPVCVGFGIRTPEAARAIAANADGAVVGTALVDALRGSLDADGRATAKTVGAVVDLAAALAQGVRGAKQAAEIRWWAATCRLRGRHISAARPAEVNCRV